MADTEYPIRTRTEQIIEARFGRATADVLRELYHDRRLTQAEIAEELNVSRGTVIELMKRHDVPTGYNRSTEAVA